MVKTQVPPILINVVPVHGAHAHANSGSDADSEFLPTLQKGMVKFLDRVGVERGDKEQAWAKSWKAAVQHNPTFRKGLPEAARASVREAARYRTEALIERYKEPVHQRTHEKRIVDISDSLTKDFGSYLSDEKMKIGTTQKFINLALKYYWCFGLVAEPPQCPLDRIVQKNAGIALTDIASWTKIATIEEYQLAMTKLNEVSENFSSPKLSLAEWELRHGW
jgi:hypothetical protein